ncbi:N-acetylmuramoyl-L-alanine amidase-like domain-containing protein [Tumidithrix elongata RA019]|uniref:N-acetylmuramoyl-L-alanine amidase-like domain-containing protein n=1 Tax=Tumidithrix elongata BACA0141 TaxID=2716417 RepID=A0AAW9PWX0_9CYAN|nr:N-acetylmuramoyl-L-alanine amidase-like domain-containing protein [Tumidithrix elongata RA019]
MGNLMGLAVVGVLGLGILVFPEVSTQPPSLALTQPLSSPPIALPNSANQVKTHEITNEAKFDRVMQYAIAQKLHQRPMSEIMQAIATQFLDTPYQAGILDRLPQEELVVRLDGFDCVLFIETVLAMARGIAQQDYSHTTFVHQIESLRYRNGQLDGYCSRLHYFSEWISDNQTRSLVKDLTPMLSDVTLPQTLDFMSQHRDRYPQLAKDERTFECIKAQEARLTSLRMYYIPSKQVKDAYDKMQPGDIVAIATKIKGLDVTHTGLVYRSPEGKIGLIHASPSGKVKISPDLQTYVLGVKEQAGIMLIRPNDPRSHP